MLSLLTGLATGCGRANTIYSDAKNPGADSVTGRDSHSLLPDGFADQSTNDGLIEVLNPGLSDSSVRFFGSRAILGITKYDRIALSNFALEFTTTGSKPLTAALLIDHDCSSQADSEIETLIASDIAAGTSITSSDSIWTTEESETSVSLDQILSSSPNACLKNGLSSIEGFPSVPVGAVLLLNGEPDSTTSETIDLKTLNIYSDTFTAWGAQ